ncbi:hypothetical protein SADUNF_Sadunf14G0071000 [Salix dunnii]|uniref:Uncharacterized protein n=1 Tax=Salix dunnii TaxID=1413687 RepID=A0A835JIG7_9ROSI|nr:hypothetical protein SADUNF_Sadunf14G0071000 [Salix dunnii]
MGFSKNEADLTRPEAARCGKRSTLESLCSPLKNGMIEWAPTRTRKIGLTRIAMQIGSVLPCHFYCNRELETESMERDRRGRFDICHVRDHSGLGYVLVGMPSLFTILKRTDTFFVSLLTFGLMVAGAGSFHFLTFSTRGLILPRLLETEFPLLEVGGVSAKQQKNCRQKNVRRIDLATCCVFFCLKSIRSMFLQGENSQIPCTRRSRVPLLRGRVEKGAI